MAAKKPAKYWKNKSDKLFSEIVRNVGECRACGSVANLQTAHIVSRKYSRVRCDLRNAVCLCARCHFHYTINPVEWGKWVSRTLGDALYEEVWAEAQKTTKVDWEQIFVQLSEIKIG